MPQIIVCALDASFFECVLAVNRVLSQLSPLQPAVAMDQRGLATNQNLEFGLTDFLFQFLHWKPRCPLNRTLGIIKLTITIQPKRK